MRRYDNFKQRDRIRFFLNLLHILCALIASFAVVSILLGWQHGDWFLIVDAILFGLLELSVAAKGWDEFYRFVRFVGTYQSQHRRLLISGWFLVIVGTGVLVFKVVAL